MGSRRGDIYTSYNIQSGRKTKLLKTFTKTLRETRNVTSNIVVFDTVDLSKTFNWTDYVDKKIIKSSRSFTVFFQYIRLLLRFSLSPSQLNHSSRYIIYNNTEVFPIISKFHLYVDWNLNVYHFNQIPLTGI